MPPKASSTTHGNGRFGGRVLWSLAILVILGAACEGRTPMRIRPGPVVTASRIARSDEFMQKIAVMPFYPEVPSARSIGGGIAGVSWDSAALVASYFSDALAAQGVAVIAPSDLEVAFAGQGLPVPRLDPKTAAERAANDFGATAVVLGRVTRWRERDGSAAGATRPASVAFEVSLHEAPRADASGPDASMRPRSPSPRRSCGLVSIPAVARAGSRPRSSRAGGRARSPSR